MTNNVENIVLDHLVALRNELKEFRQEVREELQIIKLRLNSVERAVSGSHDDNVIVQMRIDKVDGKIDKDRKTIGTCRVINHFARLTPIPEARTKLHEQL